VVIRGHSCVLLDKTILKLQLAAVVCNLNRSFAKNSRFIQPNGHSAGMTKGRVVKTGVQLYKCQIPIYYS
jgi:hypothetical protein